jgi:hypothetical protein
MTGRLRSIVKKTQSKVFALGICMNVSGTQFEDQYSQKISWQAFCQKPHIFVLAGKKASEDASKWGLFLQKKLNSSYEPGKNHLKNFEKDEKVKVVAVATLPDVPGMFKGLFRSGFRDKSLMSVVLDFGAKFSQSFGFEAEEPAPAIVLYPDGSAEDSEPKAVIREKWRDEVFAEKIYQKWIASQFTAQ